MSQLDTQSNHDSQIDEDGMAWPSIGTRDRLNESQEKRQERLDEIAGAVKTILNGLGEDVDREGIVFTLLI